MSPSGDLPDTFETDDFVITLYIVSIGAFILLFAPFMATRHLLLILPFILLFSAPIIETATKSVNRFSLALTISLGLLLGISDYLFAGYYRKMATRFIPAPGSVIWTAGHWGWQWYTSLNGVKQYETGSVEVKEGDIFVYPAKVAKQEFKERRNTWNWRSLKPCMIKAMFLLFSLAIIKPASILLQ